MQILIFMPEFCKVIP